MMARTGTIMHCKFHVLLITMVEHATLAASKALLNVTFPHTNCSKTRAQNFSRSDLEQHFGSGAHAFPEKGFEHAKLGCDGTLQLLYPEGCVGSQQCALQIKQTLTPSVDEAWMQYSLQFGNSFDFIKGGKLPGLCGGTCPTGCKNVTGMDGWSARLMWRPGGQIVLYVYFPGKQSNCGDDVLWLDPNSGSIQRFVLGRMHSIVIHVRMNQPGVSDGLLEAYLDGATKPSVSQRMKFRDVGTFAIDTFYLSTFFGGTGGDWAPSKDEHASFGNFLISESSLLPVSTSQAASKDPPLTAAYASRGHPRTRYGPCILLNLSNHDYN
eukprot:TRINITY_DN10192_c0_g1_i1.p1 TRINITY_DN10192_c0_g1~~TRINITY_DN10192_c0_g1_i1.p1  ORF type:complete len:324 (-),score=23.26 TRINITY_DN10192_c0_g1_i1:247-1218(-)